MTKYYKTQYHHSLCVKIPLLTIVWHYCRTLQCWCATNILAWHSFSFGYITKAKGVIGLHWKIYEGLLHFRIASNFIVSMEYISCFPSVIWDSAVPLNLLHEANFWWSKMIPIRCFHFLLIWAHLNISMSTSVSVSASSTSASSASAPASASAPVYASPSAPASASSTSISTPTSASAFPSICPNRTSVFGSTYHLCLQTPLSFNWHFSRLLWVLLV